MELTDTRSLGGEARAGRRKMVIKLRKGGATYKAIAETGLSLTGVFNTCKRYAELGAKAWKDAPKGRRRGEGRRLSAGQEAEIQKLIANKMPAQLKMPYALWSRSAVAALSAERYGIVLPVRTMGHHLKRWRFTPQKPEKRALQRNGKAIAQWKRRTWPALKKKRSGKAAPSSS